MGLQKFLQISQLKKRIELGQFLIHPVLWVLAMLVCLGYGGEKFWAIFSKYGYSLQERTKQDPVSYQLCTILSGRPGRN